MTYKKIMLRELRNAHRVIGNPDLFSQSLIKTSWLVINNANRKNIHLDFSFGKLGTACSPSQQSATGRLHTLQT